MAMNRIQFQPGLSLSAFQQQFGAESQCQTALEQARWPQGFRCPHCQHPACYRIQGRTHPLFQCRACRKQTSLTAGTLFEKSPLPLRLWFLALYLIGEAKTGLSALALKRQLGVNYRTAWLVQHKIMQAMLERDASYQLDGVVQVDDAYLGGERSGGKAGRGSENKIPFVAAVALDQWQHPRYLKLSPVAGFTQQAIRAWAEDGLQPGAHVISDGLSCFGAVTQAGCTHEAHVAGGKKPKDLPMFRWINTLLGNVKTSLSGTYHAFAFGKYADRYLAAIAYRFNRRYRLDTLPRHLLTAAVACMPKTENKLRKKAEVAT
ncbi:IS1595 family transposase [Chitinilyticum litopenaei]|uniref:IS1595 family transposase n=1 Tax=Chitinilyticum litopenaei TaxID=1121276 RepID=UPI00041409BC|nr:IS1595 family transposase [Chitinilyticum litopenaei]